MSSNKPLKVGFDLDGVILYNPIRVIRPLITNFKKSVLKKRKTKFYVPQDPFQQSLFRLFHKSSIFIDPGFHLVKPLVDQDRIEAHLITGRFSFLKDDLDIWLDKIYANDIFTTISYNQKDEQPHLYKYEKVTRLNLDIYIEDNWDIVKYLNYKCERENNPLTTCWIYNIMDKQIDYPHRYPSLKPAIQSLIETYNF